MEKKVYLGDSVYATFDGLYIWLTTENGYEDDPRNKIALEPAIFAALLKYAKVWNFDREETQTEKE